MISVFFIEVYLDLVISLAGSIMLGVWIFGRVEERVVVR